MNKQITILHLVHCLSVGGAERVLVNVLNGTSDRFRHIICSFLPVDGNFVKHIKENRRHVICLNKKSGNNYLLPFRIASICREFEVDIVHAQGWGTYAEGVFGSILSLKKPAFIFAFRGKTLEDLDSIPFRRILAQRLLAHYCTAILTPSVQMAAEYARDIGLGAKRVDVIYNGVDASLFLPPSKPDDAKQRIGLPSNALVLGCIARFDPVKNLYSLVLGFAELAEHNNLLYLILVGAGECTNEIVALVRKLGIADKVLLAGGTTEVIKYYQAMDVYVQPSLYEGVSNTILEAMSSGLPVVAGRVGGTPEIVIDGVNGLLLDHLSHSCLTLGINTLVSDPELRKKMGKKGREMVIADFSLSAMVTNYESMFDASINNRNPFGSCSQAKQPVSSGDN